jgi:multicomponent Na+:H+ antiporter subunit B
VIGEYAGQVVRVVCVLMAPLIITFGIYVVLHGHYGPGGGFAGGIVIGVGVILLRITVATELSARYLPPALGPLAAGVGVLGFILVGAASLVSGGQLLDYAAVDIGGLEDRDLRYLGILVVEVFVGVAVSGVMLTLFDNLAAEGRRSAGGRR